LRETADIYTDAKSKIAKYERLFAFMSRNAAQLIPFYRLPPERVIEIGIRVEI
jgi:K+ transporter